ncbi:unnamed protein product [Euphydryas editha]|uniref:Uncharacterized protein n=1 Tax=Euphydryas editha TaxID=104508 RepID=A0AAU9US82_EUPED|nr:unnamed protein product [Euphydryas editha]
MSDSELPKNVKIHKLPFVIKKNAITSYDKLKPNYDLLFRCVKNTKQNIFKEDIIYKSKEHDTFSGKFPNLIITNMLNVIKNTSRTVATYNENSSTIELNSDAVTRVIGQKNYDIVFGALCSVISQDLKVQGILSLLTLDKKINNVNTVVQSENKFSQTDETCREIFMRNKQRRHIRKKQIRSYAVDDDMLPAKQMKKVIIDPKNLNLIKTEKIKVESDEKSLEKNLEEESSNSNLNDESSENTQLPDLKLLLDEDSNISDTSVGNISIGSCNIPNILENPKSILNNIDKHTKETDISNLTAIKMIDGSLVMIRGNPDMFHLTSPDVLENLSSQDRKKILLHQAYIDWKFCLQTDCDGYL